VGGWAPRAPRDCAPSAFLCVGARPITVTVRQHAMVGGWHQFQSAAKAYLWLSWATAAWGLTSFAIIHWHVGLPHSVGLLTALSRGFTLLGGCLAVLYVLVGARRTSLAVSGVAAAVVNFWYCWDYIRSLV
jgi:hypothetical protein